MQRVHEVGNDPAKTLRDAIHLLQQEKKPISKATLSEVTPYTKVQIAGIIGRDFNLESIYKSVRHAH